MGMGDDNPPEPPRLPRGSGVIRFGLFCSAQANSNDLPAESGQGFRDYLDFYVEAEALGFHSISSSSITSPAGIRSPPRLMLLPPALRAHRELRLGTGGLVLPWHNPVLLAEQAATLDLASPVGGFYLGIGKGYRHSEFAGFPDSRGMRPTRGSRRRSRSSS